MFFRWDFKHSLRFVCARSQNTCAEGFILMSVPASCFAPNCTHSVLEVRYGVVVLVEINSWLSGVLRQIETKNLPWSTQKWLFTQRPPKAVVHPTNSVFQTRKCCKTCPGQWCLTIILASKHGSVMCIEICIVLMVNKPNFVIKDITTVCYVL